MLFRRKYFSWVSQDVKSRHAKIKEDKITGSQGCRYRVSGDMKEVSMWLKLGRDTINLITAFCGGIKGRQKHKNLNVQPNLMINQLQIKWKFIEVHFEIKLSWYVSIFKEVGNGYIFCNFLKNIKSNNCYFPIHVQVWMFRNWFVKWFKYL